MDPSFLKYLGVFFLLAASQGLFFSFTQLSFGKKLSAPRLFLSLIIFLFSLALAESGLWWSERISDFAHMVWVSEPLPFIFGPLVYFYFKSSLTPYRYEKKDLLHFIPFGLYFIYCSQFYFSSTSQKEAMLADLITFKSFFLLYLKSAYTWPIKAASLLTYGILIWRKFYDTAVVLKEVRNWFLLTLGVFAFYTLNFIGFHALERLGVVGGCSDYGIASAISIFIYLFSWFGYARPKVFEGYGVNEALRPAPAQKYKSSVLSDDFEKELSEQLRDLMLKEQLYKDDMLRLDTLAERLGVSRNSISQVINKTGMNFFEYVNSWRIEEAKKILAETTKQELNVIEVAYEVGFNNKVSFNKFFKKSTGLTPTEFRKTALEKKA